MRVNELIKKVEEILGKKAMIKNIEKQKGAVNDTLAGISSTKELLNWSQKVNIRDKEGGINFSFSTGFLFSKKKKCCNVFGEFFIGGHKCY